MELNLIKKKVDDFCKQNNLSNSPEFRFLDLVSEVGELSKEILKSSDYGKKKIQLTENMKSEFGDILFSLITTANAFDVNLETELNSVLEKYERRMTKGSPDSGND